MKLTWYGHACFKLESEDGSLVFDPFKSGYPQRLVMPPVEADAVSCSHGHGDHCYVEGVTLTGNKPAFSLRQVMSFHDNVQGEKYGVNQIAVVEMEGKSVVHLGDLGHLLTQEQIDAIGPVDVLLVPVGGYYTIDADTAYAVCQQLQPRVIVPMHYRQGDAGLPLVSELEPFLRNFESEKIVYSPSGCFETDDLPNGCVLVFPWPRN